MKGLQSLTKIFQEKFGIVNFHHYLFLALLGVLTAIVATIVDLLAYFVIDCKTTSCKRFSQSNSVH